MDLVVDALATHRLTKLVVDDEITAPIREKIFDKYPPDTNKWAYLISCPWCSSVWVGAGVVAVRRLFPRAWAPMAELLAFSSVAGLIQEHV